MRRRRVKKQADVDRYLTQGLGQGERESYQPWLRVQDVPSRGRSHKVSGSIVDRVYHLFSDLEYACWLQLDFSELVIDIREQFPLLPVSALQAIASSKGIDYPVYLGTDVPYVMTTDFVITVRQPDGSPKLVARTVKPYAEVTSGDSLLRTLQKLEIEADFWRAQGVDWSCVTQENLPVNLTRNLEWLRKGLPFQQQLHDEQLQTRFISELVRARDFGWTLGKTLKHISTRLFLQYEDCAQLFRCVVWHKLIVIDLSQPVILTAPLPKFEISSNTFLDNHVLEVV